ncbi:MAG: histidine phosphatase family protein [Lentisphaeria bacterium]|nr:histidine phosphatase family protein [Lentisphaeria bacterium]
MKRILLIRHGEVEEAYRGRFIGSTDAPLSESGRADCRALRERVAAYAPAVFYHSPQRRAAETLELVKPEGARIVADPRLREIDFGEWENLLFDEIARTATPEQLRVWAENPAGMLFPGGEPYAAFAARVDAFSRDLLAAPEESAAIVTHGGVLMRMISVWKQLPPERQHEVLPPRGSLTVFECNQGVMNHVE